MNTLKHIEGGVTAPVGFRAHGLNAGIKPKEPDMSMLVSDVPGDAAAVFTKNRLVGAHVSVCRERIKGGKAQAVVVNSGNANACTGEQGLADAREMASVAGHALGIDEDLVYPCSTGSIGVALPMDAVRGGIRDLADRVSKEGGQAAATGILTTDTAHKEVAVETIVSGQRVRIGAMAKGAGMIQPDMATMLAFITTDAGVTADALQSCLTDAVTLSFNRISVDGDQSCNDTVLFLANGRAANPLLDTASKDWEAFSQAVRAVTAELANMIVADGEGATKFVTVRVSGAASAEDADLAARAIANSLLVKTAMYGENAHALWGRAITAVGYSGIACDLSRCDVYLNETAVALGGISAGTEEQSRDIVASPRYTLDVKLYEGQGQGTIFTCDCSEAYVKLNM
jgi:glutamate N-acetyltransferase/amino-acid N-acetyltransferase